MIDLAQGEAAYLLGLLASAAIARAEKAEQDRDQLIAAARLARCQATATK